MGSINLINGGLDVQGIVDKLIYVEREPIRRFENQQDVFKTRNTAFQTLNTKVSSLLTKVQDVLFKGDSIPLSTPYSFKERFDKSVFALRTASSSNEQVFTATASKGTAYGAYNITVSQLAQAKSMASSNFASSTATNTGTGTLVIQAGTGSPVTVTIDATNNTLEGVRQAINNAKAGVSATIINDGSASPHRLVLTADNTGTANAFTVTDNLTGGQALGLAQTVAAADAQFTVNGISITKSSNTVGDVISGVTLNLKSTSASAVTLTLERDTETVVTTLKDFVAAYNDFNAYVNSQSKYDAKNKSAGVLAGDATVRKTQAKIQSLMTQSASNPYTSFNVLGQVGIKTNNDGSLTVDETKLRDSLAQNFTGVAALLLGDGANEVAATATLTDARVTYNGKTSATQSGTYGIQVNTLAEKATIVGNQTVSNLTQNETLTITRGAVNTTVNLLAGDSLATVLTKINNALTADGNPITATDDGTGKIKLQSNAYGSSETITAVSNQLDLPGFTGIGTAPISDSGVTLAGTLNGHAFTANGLTITGATGQPEEGLQLTIAQTTTESYGQVTFNAGTPAQEGSSIIVNLRTAMKTITDPLTGPIQIAKNGLDSNIKALDKAIEQYEYRLEIRKEMLTRQFAKADEALRLLSVSQNSLSNQTASLSKLKQ